MQRKNNKKNSSHKPVSTVKDTFNVKENLQKLRSGNGKESYETEINFQGSKHNSNNYYGTNQREDFDGYSSMSTIDRFEKINDKVNTDISNLKENIFDHKELISEKLHNKLERNDLKWWISGIIGGLIFVGGIIYTFSYQEVIQDVKKLNENSIIVNEKIIIIDNKINQSEKNQIQLNKSNKIDSLKNK